MSTSKDTLVNVLRVRYDAHSAEAVFQMACARAGLEGTTAFETKELRAFRDAVERVGDRVTSVLAQIDDLIEGAGGKSDGKPAAKAEAPKAEAPKAEAAKAEAPKAEKADKKAEPAPAKTEAAQAAGTTIMLRGVDTEEGEQVLICGALENLGNWDPALARPMVREGDGWLAKVELPADAEVAFKFLCRGSDGEVTWEPGGNRVARANERLEATWRSAS
jgi:hypothetical protein